MIEGDKFFWWLEKVADIRNLKKKKKNKNTAAG